MVCARPRRMKGWSSTISTRVSAIVGRRMVFLAFYGTTSLGPAASDRFDRQVCSDGIGSILHDPHPQACGARRRVAGNARTVISNRQRHLAARLRQRDRHAPGAAVLDGIMNGLLGDAKQVRGHFVVANLNLAVSFERTADLRALLSRRRLLLQGRYETLGVDVHRVQTF